MIFGFIAIVGLIAGIFIAKYAKEELKNGEKWFSLLNCLIILALIIVSFKINLNIAGLIIGLVFGLLVKKEYFYFGIGIASLINKNINFLYSILVFLYGMPYGSLIYYKKQLKNITFDIVLFLIPALLYFLSADLTSFSAGGLIGILIFKIKESYSCFLKA